VIAVDSDPFAAHAAELGIELATALGAEIAFLHAIEPGLSQAPGLTPNQLIAEAEREGRQLIAVFCQLLPPAYSPLKFIQLGRLASEIVRTAKEWPADVIVIGGHGRHGIRRALLGSVAEEMMRHAPCPVLVVQARE
jgi:nucleotide-binding universal stress UspA family protein